MFSGIKTIWKVGMALGATIIAGSAGGAAYDYYKEKNSAVPTVGGIPDMDQDVVIDTTDASDDSDFNQ
jgi:hypothetical protein